MKVKSLKETFKILKDQGRKAIVPYIMCGDVSYENTKKVIKDLYSYGATAIELGVPFSDPVADGEIIQKAGEKALQNKINLKGILNMVRELRAECDIPLIVMSYLNPIFSFGIEGFCEELQQCQIEGVIIPDLPLEETDLLLEELNKRNLSFIPLAAPTSDEERIKKLSELGEGFLYVVTVAGVTGERKEFKEETLALLNMAKKVSALPVLAGFGISSREQVEEISSYCDGVIIGSKVVKLLENGDYEEIKKLLNSKSILSFWLVSLLLQLYIGLLRCHC